MNGVNFMSLNKNDKEARDINLEHAERLDNSSNQIQEVEMQDGSKNENDSGKSKLFINSKTMKIIMGGVVLVIGIGIGVIATKAISTDSIDSVSPDDDFMSSGVSVIDDTTIMNHNSSIDSTSLSENDFDSDDAEVVEQYTFTTDPKVTELTEEYFEEMNLLSSSSDGQLASDWGIILDLFNDYPYDDYSKECHIFWGLSPYYVIVSKDQNDTNHAYLFETDNIDYIGYDYLRDKEVDLRDSKQIIYFRYPLLARTGMTMDKELGDEGFLRITESTKSAMITVTKQGFINGLNKFLHFIGEEKITDQFGSDEKILVKE